MRLQETMNMDNVRFRRDLDRNVCKLFERMVVTREAFTKMNAYARTASRIAGSDIECGGLLVGKQRDGVPIITDAMLLDCVVTRASGHFDYDSVNKEYLQARDEGRLIMGMWHSHGDFGVFHSGHDDACLDGLLDRNERILPNLLLRSVKKTPLQGARLYIGNAFLGIVGQSGQRYDVCFAVQDEKAQDAVEEALRHVNVYAKQVQGVPFAVSIVINKESYGNPETITYPEMGRTVYIEAVAKHPGLKQKRLKRRGIPLHIVDGGVGLPDEQSINEEVCRKITYQGEKLFAWAQRMATGESTMEENIKRCANEQGTANECTLETRIDRDPIAKMYDRIVQSSEYGAAIEKKIIRKHRMLQAKRLLQRLAPDDARHVYLQYKNLQYKKEQDDEQVQTKASQETAKKL